MTVQSQTETTFILPARRGPKPETTQPARDNPMPHKQLSQNAPVRLQQELFERMKGLANTTVSDSLVSVPGALALHLDEDCASGPAKAFQRGYEFAHLHPHHDGSLHMTLPHRIHEDVLAKGWGEPHPVSGTIMVWGPRDQSELEVVWQLLRASYDYASSVPIQTSARL